MDEHAADLADLVAIIHRLRGPEGCPWDRAQTHASLAPFALEEAREVMAAIAAGGADELADELGDLLLQVLLHAEIGAEQGTFDLRAIADRLAAKLVRRHPHVFGDQQPARDPQEVERRWAAIKAEEAAQGDAPALWLDAVARTLPALAEAEALGQRAGQVGFDWREPAAAWPKVAEEMGEFAEAWRRWEAGGRPEGIPRLELAAELGDLLFAVVNVARLLGIDAESALAGTNERFRRRFARVQEWVAPDAEGLRAAGLAALDAAWERAKAEERAIAAEPQGAAAPPHGPQRA